MGGIPRFTRAQHNNAGGVGRRDLERRGPCGARVSEADFDAAAGRCQSVRFDTREETRRHTSAATSAWFQPAGVAAEAMVGAAVANLALGKVCGDSLREFKT